jgi:hypothetical protein
MSGVPQMRQSEGNRTAKRLSAICPVQLEPDLVRSDLVRSGVIPSGFVLSFGEAMEGRATAALAWLARILSSLLLKTASVLPAEIVNGRATLRLPAAIEYNGGWLREAMPLGNVAVGSRNRRRHFLHRLWQPLFNGDEQ